MAKGDANNPGAQVPLSVQYPPGSLGEYPTPPSPVSEHVVDPFAFHFPAAPDYGALYAEQAAAAAAAQAEAERKAGEQERDQLYADYLNAVGTATDFINTEIGKEQANASLLGIDYQVTDQMKTDRISNYFASIWGEGDQTRLDQLFSSWGKPGGFDGWLIERGDASAYQGGQEIPGDQGVATSTGTKPRPTLTTGQEEETLSQATVLGG